MASSGHDGRAGQYGCASLDSVGSSVFAVSSNNGTSVVVVQANTSLTLSYSVNIGQGSTSVNMYDGDFDNNFTTPFWSSFGLRHRRRQHPALFWSVSQNCSLGANGCVMSLVNGVPGPNSPRQNGGASGIIVNNNSTAGQASSIYFSTEAAPLQAVKLTQQNLN